MSQQDGYSPSFKRPAEIMRMRRKRARSDAGVFSSPSGQGSSGSPGQSSLSPASVRPFSPGPLFAGQQRSGGGIKRRNPFANIENTFSPKKKLLIYNDAGEEAAESYKKTAQKDGDGDALARKANLGDCNLSEKLIEAEKRESQHIPSEVGYNTAELQVTRRCSGKHVNTKVHSKSVTF